MNEFDPLIAGLALLAAIFLGLWIYSISRMKQYALEVTHQKTQCHHLQEQLDQADIELDSIKLEVIRLRDQNARLSTSLEERNRFHAEQLALVQANREMLKQEFEQLANDVLERKGASFSQLSQQQLQRLLMPLHHDVKGFREKVEHIHSEDLKQRSELKTELLHLQKLNRDITDQADKLTQALQGQRKVQGNWGELILENVLDSAGLRQGKDYHREVSFNTEQGRRRPDVIVYLPEQRHLIIDAKTSLSAYTRYINAEDDITGQAALKEHVSAISARMKELSDKRYFELPNLNSPDLVVMFIPIESAYVAALRLDEALFQRAIEMNILIATPATLLSSLTLVRQLWRFENQSRHTAELAKRAERFYSKLKGFIDTMQGIGQQLDKTKETYDRAFSQLYTGKGNVIKQASEFRELGVSVQQELDEELVEKAKLESSKSI